MMMVMTLPFHRHFSLFHFHELCSVLLSPNLLRRISSLSSLSSLFFLATSTSHYQSINQSNRQIIFSSSTYAFLLHNSSPAPTPAMLPPCSRHAPRSSPCIPPRHAFNLIATTLSLSHSHIDKRGRCCACDLCRDADDS